MGAFFSPVYAHAQSLQYGQSFENLTTGDLVPQDGWIQSAALSTRPQVVASTSCYASKCVQFNPGATGADVIEQEFDESSYVSAFYQLRLDGTYTTSFNSVIGHFTGTTSTQTAQLRMVRTNSTDYCLDLTATTGADTEDVKCGLNYHQTYLVNVVADLRNYPNACHYYTSIDSGSHVKHSSTVCNSDLIDSIVFRWQGVGNERISSIDNIVVSASPSFISLSTTTAPFSSTDLDSFCGEIATSTSFVDSIGSSFGNGICRTFAYFFVPNTQSISQFGMLSTEVASKFPFSWAVDIRNLLGSYSTTSEDAFINVSISLGDAGDALGLSNVQVISTSTISTYMSDGVRSAFKTLISAILYLLAVSFIYYSLQNIWHKQT